MRKSLQKVLLSLLIIVVIMETPQTQSPQYELFMTTPFNVKRMGTDQTGKYWITAGVDPS